MKITADHIMALVFGLGLFLIVFAILRVRASRRARRTRLERAKRQHQADLDRDARMQRAALDRGLSGYPEFGLREVRIAPAQRCEPVRRRTAAPRTERSADDVFGGGVLDATVSWAGDSRAEHSVAFHGGGGGESAGGGASGSWDDNSSSSSDSSSDSGSSSSDSGGSSGGD